MSSCACHRFLEKLLHGAGSAFLPEGVYSSPQSTRSSVRNWAWSQRIAVNVHRVKGGFDVVRLDPRPPAEPPRKIDRSEPAPAAVRCTGITWAGDQCKRRGGLVELAGETVRRCKVHSDQVEPVLRQSRARRTGPGARARATTTPAKRLTRAELRIGALLYPPVDVSTPLERGDCAWCPVCQEAADSAEPAVAEVLACGHRAELAFMRARSCAFVSCKHHLYLDVDPNTGSIKLNFPDLEPWEIAESCALDVADRAGITLEEVGEIMNLTRERIRQIEVRGLLKIKMASPSPEELGSVADQVRGATR